VIRLPLTNKQNTFYKILCAIDQSGQVYTYKQLAEIYGCNSTSTIYKLMQQLKNRGWIDFVPASNKMRYMIE